MPEERFQLQDHAIDVRPSNRQKWRGKLLAVEERFRRNSNDKESTDDDIANFLQHAATGERTRSAPAQLASRTSTTATSDTPVPAEVLGPLMVDDVYRPPKLPQNKGLRVTFVATPPEIIGMGGDEAELPSSEVFASLGGASHHPQASAADVPASVTEGALQRGRRPSPVPTDDPLFEPKPMKRAPTGLSDIFSEEELHTSTRSLRSSSRSPSASPSSKLKPLPPPPVSIRNYIGVHLDSDPREVQLDIPPLDDNDRNSDNGRVSKMKEAGKKNQEAYLNVPSPGLLAGNSITPRPSPQASPAYFEAQPSGYGFPAASPKTHATPRMTYSNPRNDIDATPADASISKTKAFTLRQVAKGLGDDSLDDFDSRVRRFNDIFRLGVSAHAEVMVVPFANWIRAACWWFLAGRQGLENEVRSKSATSTDGTQSPVLKQAYVNLAKSWWIVKDITPNHPEIARFGKASMNSLCAMIKSFGDQTLAELAEVHVHVVANMRALTMSMKRNGRLPPSDLEIQRLNLHVLLETSRLPQNLVVPVVNNIQGNPAGGQRNIANPFFPIPVGDTDRHFNFGRMFIEISAHSDAPDQNFRAPCLLSVLRDRRECGVQAALASQDGQVNLIISDEMTGALPWKNVHWQIQSHELILTVLTESGASNKLQIRFVEKDFKTLWGICDYTQRIKKDMSTRNDEELIFERKLRSFQCDDATRFPSDSIPNCRLLIFERKSPLPEWHEQKMSHNGFRLVVVTPTSMKALSMVKHDLGRENPILFGIHRGKDGSRLVLRIMPSSTRLSPTFANTEDIDLFRHLLSGTLKNEDDWYLPSLQLDGMSITGNSMGISMSAEDSHGLAKLPWHRLRIIGKKSNPQSHEGPPIESKVLRVLADTDFGTFTDRITLMSGELKLSLSTENLNELQILRSPQSNMTWSLADEKVSKEALNSICVTLKTMLTASTIRRYSLHSLQDLHTFQSIITGYSVLFDGIASNFAISRRRTVVPMHKKFEASSTRLQILKHDKTIQLAGFFREFNYGNCMNFVLKVTDIFETFEKGESFFLRIVDAKFPLSKKANDESKDFICLDAPEYPSEHDDITIGFENEHEIDLEKHCQLQSLECPEWRLCEGESGGKGWLFDIY